MPASRVLSAANDRYDYLTEPSVHDSVSQVSSNHYSEASAARGRSRLQEQFEFDRPAYETRTITPSYAGRSTVSRHGASSRIEELSDNYQGSHVSRAPSAAPSRASTVKRSASVAGSSHTVPAYEPAMSEAHRSRAGSIAGGSVAGSSHSRAYQVVPLSGSRSRAVSVSGSTQTRPYEIIELPARSRAGAVAGSSHTVRAYEPSVAPSRHSRAPSAAPSSHSRARDGDFLVPGPPASAAPSTRSRYPPPAMLNSRSHKMPHRSSSTHRGNDDIFDTNAMKGALIESAAAGHNVSMYQTVHIKTANGDEIKYASAAHARNGRDLPVRAQEFHW